MDAASAATRLQSVQRGHAARLHAAHDAAATWVADVKSEFEEHGFCHVWAEFNLELVRPFQQLHEMADAQGGTARSYALAACQLGAPVLASLGIVSIRGIKG